MLESINEVLSVLSLIVILLIPIYYFVKEILKKHERKRIEREIEYYKEW